MVSFHQNTETNNVGCCEWNSNIIIVWFEAYRAAEDAKKFKVVSKYATSRYSTREEARVVCEKLNELGELADVVEL